MSHVGLRHLSVVSNKIACNTVMSLLLESIDCLLSAVYINIPCDSILIRRLWKPKTAPKLGIVYLNHEQSPSSLIFFKVVSSSCSSSGLLLIVSVYS